MRVLDRDGSLGTSPSPISVALSGLGIVDGFGYRGLHPRLYSVAATRLQEEMELVDDSGLEDAGRFMPGLRPWEMRFVVT